MDRSRGCLEKNVLDLGYGHGSEGNSAGAHNALKKQITIEDENS